MPRPFVIRRLTKTGGPFATGKHAISICQRSGFKYPYKELDGQYRTGLDPKAAYIRRIQDPLERGKQRVMDY